MYCEHWLRGRVHISIFRLSVWEISNLQKGWTLQRSVEILALLSFFSNNYLRSLNSFKMVTKFTTSSRKESM